jgi:transposase-like protein
MEHQDKTSRMLELIEQWLQSGQSQKEFARQQNVKLGTFAYWVKKYKQHHQPMNGFARIELGDTQLAPRLAKLEIALADGMVVRIF